MRFKHFSSVVIILFNTGLDESAFSIFSLKKLVISLSAFSVFCLLYVDFIFIHCEKYHNFTWFPGVEILREGTVSEYGQMAIRFLRNWI